MHSKRIGGFGRLNIDGVAHTKTEIVSLYLNRALKVEKVTTFRGINRLPEQTAAHGVHNRCIPDDLLAADALRHVP